MLRLDGASGAVKWRTAGPAPLVLIDRATKQARYIDDRTFLVDGKRNGFSASPTFAGNLLVAPSEHGLLTLRLR